MVDKIEMSLDEIIKSTRQRKSGAGGRGGVANRRNNRLQRGGSGRGGTRRGAASLKAGSGLVKGRGAGGIQKAKFTRGDVNSAWKHDLYDGPKRGGVGNVLKSTAESAKLLVSNLDYGVSDSDIKELFTEFGPLKKAAIHYDRSGRSLGTADVVFERRSDALKAIKQYNGVPLDGRPMNIQFLSTGQDLGAKILPKNRSASASPNKRRLTAPVGRRTNSRGGISGRYRGGNNGGRGGVGVGAKKLQAPTAAELDAELDAYVKDMKI